MKVCESSVQRILYRKIFNSDPLYQKCQYCCEINGFFWWSHSFYRFFLVTLWKISESDVNLYTFPDFFYIKRGRYKVYETVFFQTIWVLKCTFLKKSDAWPYLL